MDLVFLKTGQALPKQLHQCAGELCCIHDVNVSCGMPHRWACKGLHAVCVMRFAVCRIHIAQVCCTLQELLGVQPKWFDAGAKDYGFPPLALLSLEFLLLGFLELKRYQGFKKTGKVRQNVAGPQ